MPPRLALLPLQHPLSYAWTSHPNGTQNGDKNPSSSESTSSLAEPQSLEDKVKYLFEHQQIADLLNEYAYVLDVCMVDHTRIEKWVDLFTENCDVTYPFGNHKGKEGLAKWAMNAETRFFRMLHASSNFTIQFEGSDEKIAHARTTLHAICGTHEQDLGKTFQEGGYYYWSFRKDESDCGSGKWKISYLFLDINWTSGDSLGLNEPGSAD